MSLIAPINLLWLLPLVGALLALYFLRPRRRELPVSSLLLWTSVAQSSRSDTPFQRLKMSLLLFLQLLILALLVLALALPFSKPYFVTKSTYVIVLDQSAGMEATDVSPDRYTAAQLSAELFIRNNLRENDSASVVGAGLNPTVLCAQTSDKAKLIASIDRSGPLDIKADLPSALTYAHALCPAAEGIVLLSDATWSDDLDQELVRCAFSPLHLVQIGSSDAQNAGITELSERTDPSHPNGAPRILVTVDRHHSTTAQLVLNLDRNVLASSAIPAGDGPVTKVFLAPSVRLGGVVTARLTKMSRDDLSVDNVDTLVLKAVTDCKILLVSGGDPPLERALAILPDVQVFEVNPSEYSGDNGAFDLTVYDRWLPSSLPTGPALVFRAISGDMPVLAAGDDFASQQIVDWDEADPLLSYTDLSQVRIRTSMNVEPAQWGVTVADLQRGPAIVKGVHNGSSIVWFGFSPGDSNLPDQVAFPILLSNIVDTLTAASGTLKQQQRTGSVLTLPSVDGDWSINDPAGRTVDLPCYDRGGCTDTDTTRAGLYRASFGGSQQLFALAVASSGQTDIETKEHPLLSLIDGGVLHHTKVQTNLTPWIVLAAIVLVILEWLAYNRPLRYTRPI
jgi:Ca-activated chloride channel family protein